MMPYAVALTGMFLMALSIIGADGPQPLFWTCMVGLFLTVAAAGMY